MLIITKADIQQLVEYNKLTDKLVEALKHMEQGKVKMPLRTHSDFDGNTLLLMPCHDGKYLSTKLVSVFPDNPAKNEPVIYGTVVLNDGQTGRPLALIDGSSLTALRTGAVGAVGMRYTISEKINTVGLIGLGVQGYHQLLFAKHELGIRQAFIYNPDENQYRAFIQKVSKSIPGLAVEPLKSAVDLVKQSEMIITATTSNTPVLPDQEGLYDNKHIIAIGSFKPGMREMPDAVFKNISEIVVDSSHAINESGDIIYPLEKGYTEENDIVPVSKLVTGETKISTRKTTLFKSVGMALYDLAAAGWFYEKTVKTRTGLEIDL